MGLLSSQPQRHIGHVVPVACILAVLYFGQVFIKPLAIAGVLSLVIAPLVRKLGRTGLGRTTSTLTSVLLVATCVVWMGVVIAIQLVAVAEDLPRYKAAIGAKVESIKELTVRPLERFEAELKGVVPQAPATHLSAEPERPASARGAAGPSAFQATPQHAPAPDAAGDLVTRLFSALWGPLGEAGIVFILLVFILLEHESLSDRFIRVVGEDELGTTVQALSDAAHGVSRFFLSQSIVNLAFGTIIGLSLWAIGIPHAALWGVVSGLLRFVPYVGILGAGALIAVFGAAADPGWSLTLWSLGVFLLLELLVAHVVEPQVYGHSTGLAPLAVIVSALFWGAMWGPVGLLLSTPLTLCLVVLGRQVEALQPLTILLSDAPGLSAGQRFYQRALADNTDAIIQDARTFMRQGSLAKYCDHVLLPGLALGAVDFNRGRVGLQQWQRIQSNLGRLAESLANTHTRTRLGLRRRRSAVSLVDANIGAHLRQIREARLGRWQGRLDVPSGSIVLCMSFGSERDDLLTELLVRALRDDSVDARSASIDDPSDPSMAGKSVLVGTLFVVYPHAQDMDRWRTQIAEVRAALPHAILVTVKLKLDDHSADIEQVQAHVDLILHSYSEAEAFVLQGSKTA
ncbi:AI-2E family transporter [Variovorax ginsengisoli]|uniref:PurR-regulated permease PerM n=1 Tax=Variovorax ginsengisoli TaxID=363844 RepID=A0ABT9S3U3_9BURK|nr:AI-2E family transporter [Variovorax ginsengisoli]MDP9899008.1 putative PurR-regulated permease PerM [Variovorax ginsengisoli]